jgi:hypothetical protein
MILCIFITWNVTSGLPPTMFCEAEFNCDGPAKGTLIMNAMTVASYSMREH